MVAKRTSFFAVPSWNFWSLSMLQTINFQQPIFEFRFLAFFRIHFASFWFILIHFCLLFITILGSILNQINPIIAFLVDVGPNSLSFFSFFVNSWWQFDSVLKSINMTKYRLFLHTSKWLSLAWILCQFFWLWLTSGHPKRHVFICETQNQN